ncbi:transporter substrate-binding domain-containing protein [Micromonospora carbonacea]|uniref:transporter substrate-binding domain-containing protein n=1 Tax=Micromonospora carbonacea TaxID=47853 RepID=UPI00159F0643|nr:transporter substrate-binding domain-containing protein [Micromonospora carbonacea]
MGFLVFGAAGCTRSEAAASNDSSLTKVQSAKKLRYGVIVGEEPGFIRGADGEWHGYLADTAQEIAKELGLEPVAVETTWGNMALDLKTDKIDLAIGAQPTGKRSLVVDYTTHPIYTNYFSLIVTSSTRDMSRWSQLNSKDVKIGAQTGDSTLQPIQRFAPTAQTVMFDSRDKGLLALQAGRTDAQANTLLNSLMAAKSRKDLRARVVVPEPLVAAPSAVMVARNADQSLLHAVDAVVWNLNASGFVRASIVKYLAEYGITEADLPQNAVL